MTRMNKEPVLFVDIEKSRTVGAKDKVKRKRRGGGRNQEFQVPKHAPLTDVDRKKILSSLDEKGVSLDDIKSGKVTYRINENMSSGVGISIRNHGEHVGGYYFGKLGGNMGEKVLSFFKEHAVKEHMKFQKKPVRKQKISLRPWD